MTVEIEYCVPCGHLDRAIVTQRVILERFGRRVDGVRLTTGHGGVFTVRVNGEQIYDKTRAFDLDRIHLPSRPDCDGPRAAADPRRAAAIAAMSDVASVP